MDAGAKAALIARGASLLPIGVIGAEGSFSAGDTIEVVGPDGVAFARGIAGYDAAAVRRVMGQRLDAVAATLPDRYSDEVIHRDDLLILPAARQG